MARSKVSPYNRIMEGALSPLSVLAQVAERVADATLDEGGDEDAEGESDAEYEVPLARVADLLSPAGR